jgi:hypothetical protein
MSAVLLQSAPALPDNKPLTDKEMQQLFEMLESSPHYKARLKAARALGMLRKAEAIAPLSRCLKKDQDHAVRSGCAWALGSIFHPGAVGELHAAIQTEVPLVKTQAERALNYILSDFPGNIPADARFHVRIEELGDRVTKGRELTKWVQQYFLEHLMKSEDRVSVGEDMDIEEDGERPDVDRKFEPVIVLSFKGGVTDIASPKDRKAGDVKVSVELEIVLEPVGARALAKETLAATAPFAGGARPKDAWTDDPLVESQKAATKKAVGGLYPDVKKVLKL